MDLHLGHGDARRPPAHDAALRAVQKPPAKPWRGAPASSATAPPPPKVYRVEPREFRELVQRLTGAPPPARQAVSAPVPPTQPLAVRPGEEAQLYAPWCAFPMPMPGLDAGHGTLI
ncbi:hypothetical protein ABZP36_035019 [Zizania latifolia]